jgi:hypothetical protein
MQRTSTYAGVAAVLVAMSMVVFAPVSEAASLSRADQACRTAAAKALRGLEKTVHREIAACHKARSTGALDAGVDCNDTDDPGFPSKSSQKIAKARGKLDAAVLGKCRDKGGNDLASALAPHVSCPAPCTAEVANPIQTAADLSACLQCLGSQTIEAVAGQAYGLPAASVERDAGRCQAALLKGYGRLAATALKSRQLCQKAQDKLGNTDLAVCTGADPKGQISKVRSKAEAALGKSCTDALLAGLNACSTTVDGLAACAGATIDDATDTLFPAAYENRALDLCPRFVTARVLAMNSTADGVVDAFCDAGSCSGGPNDGNACDNDVHCPDTATSLSLGWTGLAHGMDVSDDYLVSVAVDCPGTWHICREGVCEGGPNDGNGCSEDLDCSDCGDCTVTGIAPSVANDHFPFFARCEARPWIACEHPLGIDPVACGPDAPECAFFLGGLEAASVGGTPTCTRNELDADISGTVNLEGGRYELSVNTRAVMHSGLSQTQPCPVCVGDTTPQDGVRDGVCRGGVNDPGALPAPASDTRCDVHAMDATYGPTSLDCPSADTANISGSGLAVSLELSTGAGAMAADIACVPAGPGNCFSAACSLAPTKACFTDGDCEAGEGTCTSKGSGADTQADACSGQCLAAAKGYGPGGVCDGVADVGTYCDGFTRADGRGLLTCDPGNGSADCEALDSACPGGDCGDCTIEEPRRCLLAPTAFGGVAARSGAGLNASYGLPGPGLLVLDLRTEASHK